MKIYSAGLWTLSWFFIASSSTPANMLPNFSSGVTSTQLWESIVSQKVVPPAIKTDGRVKVKADLIVDASRHEEFKHGSYVVAVTLEITNVSRKTLQTGDVATYMKTTSGKVYGWNDSGQSAKGYKGLLKPGQMSEKAWANVGYDSRCLFRVPVSEKVVQVIYNDGKSLLIWKVKALPKRSTRYRK